MQVINRTPLKFGNPNLEEKIFSDVYDALQNVRTTEEGFVVNDTKWFWLNPKGQLAPTVVNEAKFLSGRFQRALQDLGWEIEFAASDQRIDGYIELETETRRYALPDENYLQYISEYANLTGKHPGAVATNIYHSLCLRPSFSLDENLAELEGLLVSEEGTYTVRVGLEFETGNIASSFRALDKLNNLFLKNEIDVGVFITSEDKQTCATRVWPQSNRNGSFEELENRQFRDNLAVPLWEVGFRPDSFDASAPYLASNGEIYLMIEQVDTIEVDGEKYRKHIANGGREIFCKL